VRSAYTAVFLAQARTQYAAGFSVQSLTSLEYLITRFRFSRVMTTEDDFGGGPSSPPERYFEPVVSTA
jgi:hypothetical protein